MLDVGRVDAGSVVSLGGGGQRCIRGSRGSVYVRGCISWCITGVRSRCTVYDTPIPH